MKTIKGDLIKLAKKNKFDVIIHGCNCFNNMGAGIAKQIKVNFPEAYKVDCNTEYGDKDKLGDYSAAQVNNLIIINAYTQYRYGRGKNVDYNAIQKVFRTFNTDLQNLKIGIPKIGAGLAGGDWKKIKSIINREAKDLDITLVLLPYN